MLSPTQAQTHRAEPPGFDSLASKILHLLSPIQAQPHRAGPLGFASLVSVILHLHRMAGNRAPQALPCYVSGTTRPRLLLALLGLHAASLERLRARGSLPSVALAPGGVSSAGPPPVLQGTCCSARLLWQTLPAFSARRQELGSTRPAPACEIETTGAAGPERLHQAHRKKARTKVAPTKSKKPP